MHDEREDQAEIHLDLWPTPLLQISLVRLGGGGGEASVTSILGVDSRAGTYRGVGLEKMRNQLARE